MTYTLQYVYIIVVGAGGDVLLLNVNNIVIIAVSLYCRIGFSHGNAVFRFIKKI